MVRRGLQGLASHWALVRMHFMEYLPAARAAARQRWYGAVDAALAASAADRAAARATAAAAAAQVAFKAAARTAEQTLTTSEGVASTAAKVTLERASSVPLPVFSAADPVAAPATTGKGGVAAATGRQSIRLTAKAGPLAAVDGALLLERAASTPLADILRGLASDAGGAASPTLLSTAVMASAAQSDTKTATGSVAEDVAERRRALGGASRRNLRQGALGGSPSRFGNSKLGLAGSMGLQSLAVY